AWRLASSAWMSLMRPGASLTARTSVQPAIWISVPKSLPIVEGMLAEAATFAAGLSAATKEQLGQSFGCYILEVGRRQFGGRYFWHDQYDAPSWLSENRRFTCPGVLATRCAQAQRRPSGQHPVLLRWLCQTGEGGAPGGSGHFHLDGGQEYSHFIGPWENFQVGLCHPSDPWGDGHISSSIALAMKVWFGHTAHSQSQHSYHPSIGAEN